MATEKGGCVPCRRCGGCRLGVIREETYDILTRYGGQSDDSPSDDARSDPSESPRAGGGFSVHVDVGTTTIAMNVTRAPTSEVLADETRLNPCRIFGVDVISRIQASIQGKREEMKEMLRSSLLEGMEALLARVGLTGRDVERVVIAANTVMTYNVMGYPCNGLSRFPFRVEERGMVELDGGEWWEGFEGTQVVVFPYLSAFIGGDAVSGLAYCHFHTQDDLSVFLDLGTNGEMAIGGKKRVLCTSVAAGPAFEGGNVSCGTGSVRGAVYDVDINHHTTCQTIGGGPPIGLCGTGAVALLGELLKNEWMDGMGLLQGEYFEKGFPFATDESGHALILTQADVREMQLAIAAVRAGLEALLAKYGATWEEIHTLYLAGGFGYHVNVSKAIDVGLLPMEVKERVRPVGNAALGGAAAYLSRFGKAELQGLLTRMEEVSLANDEYFQEQFVACMNF